MKYFFTIILFVLSFQFLFAQLKINEVSNRNYSQIADAQGVYYDWIELYNTSTSNIILNNYYLSDSKTNLKKWAFPSNSSIEANKWLLIYASGNNTSTIDTKITVNHWETAVKEDDVWRWINPNASTPTNWYQSTFDDASWAQGQGGFGFADNDDNTVFLSSNISVYTRIDFNITDTTSILEAVLHIDYDDAFVAYLNGVEIARSNLTGNVKWNSTADGVTEAFMYQGQKPSEFLLDMGQIKSAWKLGTNILAVEAHNSSTTSSDMTLRTFLSFGISNSLKQFNTPPSWFDKQGILNQDAIETNFKIASEGETIYLSNDSETILDSLQIPKNLPLNHSIGCSTGGSSVIAIFKTATPNASNNTQTPYINGFEPNPVFSYPAGYHSGTIQVTITSSSATSQIRYTTDGQIPTESSSLYTNPITINTSLVLKAKCFSTSNKLESIVTTASYFIAQTPTNAGVLSITTDEVNLYGATGIYDHWDQDWKRPCYIEYFAPTTHQLAFKQNAGIKIDGGAGGSRSQPQKSFRIEPDNNLFGDGDLVYPLIPSIKRTSYETFYIRNGSNQ